MSEVKARANVLLEEAARPSLAEVGATLRELGLGGAAADAGGGAAGVGAARAPAGCDEVPDDGHRVHREGDPERPRAGAGDDRVRPAGGNRPHLRRGVLPEARARPREGRTAQGEAEARGPGDANRSGSEEVRGDPVHRVLVHDPRRRQPAGPHRDPDLGRRGVRDYVDGRDPPAAPHGVRGEPPVLRRGLTLGRRTAGRNGKDPAVAPRGGGAPQNVGGGGGGIWVCGGVEGSKAGGRGLSLPRHRANASRPTRARPTARIATTQSSVWINPSSSPAFGETVRTVTVNWTLCVLPAASVTVRLPVYDPGVR